MGRRVFLNGLREYRAHTTHEFSLGGGDDVTGVENRVIYYGA